MTETEKQTGLANAELMRRYFAGEITADQIETRMKIDRDGPWNPANPEWNFYLCDYRLTPEPKKRLLTPMELLGCWVMLDEIFHLVIGATKHMILFGGATDYVASMHRSGYRYTRDNPPTPATKWLPLETEDV